MHKFAYLKRTHKSTNNQHVPSSSESLEPRRFVERNLVFLLVHNQFRNSTSCGSCENFVTLWAMKNIGNFLPKIASDRLFCLAVNYEMKSTTTHMTLKQQRERKIRGFSLAPHTQWNEFFWAEISSFTTRKKIFASFF